jgi:hypothetical protein
MKEYFSLGASSRDEVIHTVKRAQDGAFATTRWANERGNLARTKLQINILNSTKITVVDV